MFECTGALNFELNIQIDHLEQPFKTQVSYHFFCKNNLKIKFRSFLDRNSLKQCLLYLSGFAL